MGIALQTVVGEMNNGFYFYGQSGYERRELRTASGERGTTILTQIQQILLEAGKLVYSDNGRYGSARLRSLGDSFFFKADDKMPCAEIYSHFLDYRTWPMLSERDALEQLIFLRNSSSSLNSLRKTRKSRIFDFHICILLFFMICEGQISFFLEEQA